MAVSEDFIKYIQDQMVGFGEFETKRMFGGYGLFKHATMFAMLANDRLRLRVDETNKPDFEAKGMKPFHSPGKKKGMPYWEVPQDVLEDPNALKDWAAKAFEVATNAKPKAIGSKK